MYMYVQVSRVNILSSTGCSQSGWSQWGPLIQHCITFSFLNAKRFLRDRTASRRTSRSHLIRRGQKVKKTLQPAASGQFVLKVSFKCNSYENIQESLVNFSFFFYELKIIMRILIMATFSFADNSTEIRPFQWSVQRLKPENDNQVLNLEGGGRANETALWCVAWRLHSATGRKLMKSFWNHKPVTTNSRFNMNYYCSVRNCFSIKCFLKLQVNTLAMCVGLAYFSGVYGENMGVFML